MTTDITVRMENFQDIPVRIVEQGNKRLMPLSDLATATGLNLQNLYRTLEKYSELLTPYTGLVMMTNPGQGNREVLCLNRDGVTGILMRADYLRIKDPVKRNTILSFQRWAIEILGKVMDGQAVFKAISPADVMREQMDIALTLGKAINVPVQVSAACALARTEVITGENYGFYGKRLIGTIPWEEIECLSPTELGKKMGGESPQSVNKTLCEMGMQIPVKGGWAATERGKDYCGYAPGMKFYKNGNGVWNLFPLWKESVISRIQHYRILHEN
jgi:hypothetical protein